MTKTKGYCGEYTKRLLLLTSRMFILCLSFFYIMTAIKRGSLPNEDVNDADLGSGGDWRLGLSLVVFLLIMCCQLRLPCKKATMAIGNCGGVSPDNINFLLTYLSEQAKGKGYIVQLEEGDLGYRISMFEPATHASDSDGLSLVRPLPS